MAKARGNAERGPYRSVVATRPGLKNLPVGRFALIDTGERTPRAGEVFYIDTSRWKGAPSSSRPFFVKCSREMRLGEGFEQPPGKPPKKTWEVEYGPMQASSNGPQNLIAIDLFEDDYFRSVIVGRLVAAEVS